MEVVRIVSLTGNLFLKIISYFNKMLFMMVQRIAKSFLLEARATKYEGVV